MAVTPHSEVGSRGWFPKTFAASTGQTTGPLERQTELLNTELTLTQPFIPHGVRRKDAPYASLQPIMLARAGPVYVRLRPC